MALETKLTLWPKSGTEAMPLWPGRPGRPASSGVPGPALGDKVQPGVLVRAEGDRASPRRQKAEPGG